MKKNSVEEWSKGQGEFIDAQFDMAERFCRGLKESDARKYEELKKLRLRVR